ncbi:SlyX protein [Rhodobacteraceae bacterium 2CG4]|uniref:SlyX protein n=1 Tax=Halovulum marinum TaxID=2662447 RepID=A0A6L5Z4W7_9RHOB|nr:SlyX family protein [Halovulum marinum]MSU91150.1 SlyX protein [Halovulum marinum]
MPETDRLTGLEETLTHQAAALEDLSEIVRAQADRIDRLERLVQQLRERAALAEAEGGVVIGHEKPPHY